MKRWLVAGVVALCVAVPMAWAERPTTWGTSTTKTAIGSNGDADVALWDPTTGNRAVLMGCIISAHGVAEVELEVSNTDIVPPIKFESNGYKQLGNGSFPIWVGAIDDILTYSITNADDIVSLMCYGWEA